MTIVQTENVHPPQKWEKVCLQYIWGNFQCFYFFVDIFPFPSQVEISKQNLFNPCPKFVYIKYEQGDYTDLKIITNFIYRCLCKEWTEKEMKMMLALQGRVR